MNPAQGTAEAPNDATCTTAIQGAYETAKGLRTAYVSGSGASKASAARYQVHASGSAGSITLTVERLADGTVFGPYSSDAVSWGFSPDQDRFLIVSPAGGGSGQATYRVYDLASGQPMTPLHQETLATASARLGWSQHGEFFAVSALSSPTTVDLRVYDAVTDALRLQTSVTLLVTTNGEDDFQGAGWGFSPDDDEFVYADVTGAQSTALHLVDLDAGVSRYTIALGGSAYWEFSPRGDLLGIVNQTGASTEDVRLVGTHADSDVRASATYNAIAADGFEATPAGHVYHLGTQTYVLAPLTAPVPDRCAPTWTAQAELSVSDVTATGASLSWSGADDDTAVTSYRVLRVRGQSVTQVGEIGPDTTYDVTGLDPETSYTFRVEAGDGASHWSTDGPSAPVTTATPPPAWPEDAALTASAITTSSVHLAWPSLAASGLPVTGYRLYQDGTLIASPGPTTTSRDVSGLQPCKDYAFVVQAVWSGQDGESSDGPTALVTTAAGAGFGCSRVYADKNEDGRYSGPAEAEGVNWAVSFVWTNVDADHNVLSHAEEVPAGGTGLVRYPVTGADTYLSYGWPIYDWHGSALYPSLYEPSPGDFYRRSDDPTSTDVRVYGGFGAGWSTSYMPIDGHGTIAGTLFEDANANGVRDAGEPGVPGRALYCSAEWVLATSSGTCKATTGADGSYQLDVNGAVIELGAATDPTSGPAYLWGNGYDGWYRTTPAKAYAVRDGDAFTDADFGYVHGTSSLHGQVFEDVDGDHVRDTGENGLRVLPPSLQVCVQHQSLTAAHKCAMVDADGTWTVSGLPPGSYEVTVAPGDLYTPSVPASGSFTATIGATGDDVMVPAFGIHGEYALVTGTVFSDVNQNGVRDSAEGPVEGLQICARNGTGEGSRRICGYSDADGSYALGPFPAGQLTVTGPDGYDVTTPIGDDGPGTWRGDVVTGQEVDLDFGVFQVPVPSAPTNLRATIGEGYVDLHWDPAQATPGYPVTGYHVFWYADDYDPLDADACDTDADTTSCRVQLTDPGEPINVAVDAYNDGGSGDAATLRLFTGDTDPGGDDPGGDDPGGDTGDGNQPQATKAPGVVTGLHVKARKHRQLVISWGRTAGATSYVVQVRRKPAGPWRKVEVTAAPRLRIKGTGTKAWIRVAAANSAGQGRWSRVAKTRVLR
jgi:hypothetical protein